MSLSEELCLRSDSQNSHSFSDCLVYKFQSKEDNYRRDSFEDRFCDDLCEEILQYLSLEDKLRLECVSKQFQRTVFKRQYKLYINMRGPEVHKIYLKDKVFGFKSYRNYYYIEDQSMHLFEALLKKCPNITSIESEIRPQSDINYNEDEVNKYFRLIIENCNNLSEFTLFWPINDNNFEEFHQNFGPNIKRFHPLRELKDLSRFPNIERMQITNVENVSIVPQLKLDNLKTLQIDLGHGQEYMLQIFIATFPTLKEFIVYINSDNHNAIYKPLKNISNLKHLIHFTYNDFGGNKRFLGLLKQMAKNCQNLKSISCDFRDDGLNPDTKQLLCQLKAFPALKRLNLRLFFVYNEGEDNIDVNQLFSFKLFKGFENITHLTLSLNWTHIFKESIIKEIDIILLKLQYLEIDNRFDTTPEGVIQMAETLSRLSRLETLILRFKTGVDYVTDILCNPQNPVIFILLFNTY